MAKRKLSTAKRNAWEWFSKWVRLSYADDAGYVACVTCGTVKHYTEMHAGHFIPKKRGNAIYFDERNVHPQDAYCNTFNGGMLIEYTQFMQETFGPEIVDELLALSRTTVRYTLADYEKIEQEYKRKVKELRSAIA